MPTTPIFGFRYPASSDPVSQGATNIQNLATDVEGRLVVVAHIRANAQPTSAGGETQLVSMIETDPAGLGTIVSNTFRIDVAGTYVLLPSMYTFNLGAGSNQSMIVRLNPAGANAVVTEVNPNAGIQTAGGDRWLGGTSAVVSLVANDVLRLNGVNSEATARDIYGYLVLIRVSA